MRQNKLHNDYISHCVAMATKMSHLRRSEMSDEVLIFLKKGTIQKKLIDSATNRLSFHVKGGIKHDDHPSHTPR